MLLELASAALYHLETSIALRAFRQVERGGIVLSFEDLHEVRSFPFLRPSMHPGTQLFKCRLKIKIC